MNFSMYSFTVPPEQSSFEVLNEFNIADAPLTEDFTHLFYPASFFSF